MSIASSCMSEVSVVLDGCEVILEQAIDDTFEGLQGHVNVTQCDLRSLCGLIDHDEFDFQGSTKLSDQIEDNISEMMELFKHLKTIVKTIRVKPVLEEEKTWLKTHNDQRKFDANKAKEDKKKEIQKRKDEAKEDFVKEDEKKDDGNIGVKID